MFFIEDDQQESTVTSQVEEVVKAPEINPLEQEVDSLKDKLIRALADADNNQKRFQKELQDMAKYALSQFAKDLLSVSDNLRRAMEFVPQEDLSEEMKNFLDGVLMTEKELLKVFERHGVEKVDPMGSAFDHNLHQAIFEEPKDDIPPGTVVSVMQPGYKLHERLLRPAMVGVSKKPD